MREIFGIKSAKASLGGQGVGFCGLGFVDMAISAVGSGLDFSINLFLDEDTSICRDVAGEISIGRNVDRVLDGCGLEDINHIDDKALNALFGTLLELCGACNKGETRIQGEQGGMCCPNGEEDRCHCQVDGGTWIAEKQKCCKQSRAFWASSVEECICEANGGSYCDDCN